VIGGSQPSVDAGRGLGLTGSLEKVVAALAYRRLSRLFAKALGLLHKSFFKRERVFDPAALLHGIHLHETKTAPPIADRRKMFHCWNKKISRVLAYKNTRFRNAWPKKRRAFNKVYGASVQRAQIHEQQARSAGSICNGVINAGSKQS
jgi:hypothetical protein